MAEIKDIKKDSDKYFVLVSWKGLSSLSDSWEPLDTMFEDVPSKVRSFFTRKRSTSFITAAKKSIGL